MRRLAGLFSPSNTCHHLSWFIARPAGLVSMIISVLMLSQLISTGHRTPVHLYGTDSRAIFEQITSTGHRTPVHLYETDSRAIFETLALHLTGLKTDLKALQYLQYL